ETICDSRLAQGELVGIIDVAAYSLATTANDDIIEHQIAVIDHSQDAEVFFFILEMRLDGVAVAHDGDIARYDWQTCITQIVWSIVISVGQSDIGRQGDRVRAGSLRAFTTAAEDASISVGVEDGLEQ